MNFNGVFAINIKYTQFFNTLYFKIYYKIKDAAKKSAIAGVGVELATEDMPAEKMGGYVGMMDGGSVRGQKAIQVKKKVFKGVF